MSTTWNSTPNCTNPGAPSMPGNDHGNQLRAKTYTNSNRYNRGGSNHQGGMEPEHPPTSMSQNPVDLPSMYYDQNNNFYPPPPQQPSYGGNSAYQAPYSNPNMFNNSDNCQYMAFNQHQQPYNNQYQSTEQGMMNNLNPYAHEFSPYPVNNVPNHHHHHQYKNNSSAPTHYKEEFSSDYSEYKIPAHTPHSAPPPRPYIEEVSPVIEIPEGAVTLIMPHVYLGKFMMNRAEFESKYGVRLTTNSKDGGYLIIITGEKAAEAAKEVEMMWNEPITNSDEITEGKHVIKVAPDRYEGVLCIPTESYQKLIDRRNAVESKHKVRILLKHLPAHNCYRVIIRAAKRDTALEATDELETSVISSTETPDVAS